MIERLSRLALVLLGPLVLTGCFLAPGKFTSTLTINADRTFTYSYVGEVYALNPDDMMKGLGDDKDDEDDKSGTTKSDFKQIALKEDDKSKDDDKAATDARFREMAAALAKERGFRKVEYVGDSKFLIDYRISGTLDHTFLFPYNVDAGIIIPFVVAEVRANGTVRVKAPGFANDSKSSSGLGGMGGGDADKASSRLDGVFTLDTDAKIVSQNEEEGARTENGRSIISWKATPLSSAAPMAVLRMKDAAAQ